MVPIAAAQARRGLCLLISACALAPVLRADVACPSIFGDHMVLQADRPIAIWGTAEPGETLRVRFAGSETTSTTDTAGRWSVQLPALAASAEPRDLRIQGANTLLFSDVLVGEVWLCSGQSNMEKQLGPRKGQKPTNDWEAETAAADHPSLRLFQVPPRGQEVPSIRSSEWVPCSPETIASTQFSAAGYFFGRELHAHLGVPVGVIHASFGGTMIEAWIPPAAFSSEPKIAALRDRRYSAWVEGVQPTELYASMIEPLAPYALRGFLWYQGESNLMDGDNAIYATKMRALIGGWRTVWGDASAPFYFVQLAPFYYSTREKAKKLLTPDALPLFWETQARALAVPNTSMVVTTDLAGDATDIHPTNKRDIGRRLAALALARTYERSGVTAGFAQFVSSSSRDDGSLVLTFKNTGGALRSRDGAPLTHFEVAGRDRRFHRAQATIEGDAVVLRSAEVTVPVAVRFGWHETANPNLVNADGYPVVPFRTDGWPIIIERKPADEAAVQHPASNG